MIGSATQSGSDVDDVACAPAAATAGGSLFFSPAAVRARIALTYLWRHGRLPDLAAPTRFTEMVQLRKLHDRDPRMPLLADKVRVKAHVAARLGADWVTPTLWHGHALPRVPSWAPPFVVKSRHGCRQCAFVRTGTEDWTVIRRRARRWMRSPYGLWLDEWLYRGIERGLLVEPFIAGRRVLPIDYKFFVFAGRVAFVQVHLSREQAHRWLVFDPAWRCVSHPGTRDVPPPRSLATMVAAAQELGRDFDFIRVDLYEAGTRPLFGEMTFYPGSGLYPLSPPSLDTRMGALWRDAQGADAVR